MEDVTHDHAGPGAGCGPNVASVRLPPRRTAAAPRTARCAGQSSPRIAASAPSVSPRSGSTASAPDAFSSSTP
jgi:hypothetical protein